MVKDCYSCFICWESFSLSDKKEADRVISCCRCNHHDYKYAHIDCLRYWVNSLNGSNKKCNICCTPYIIQKTKVPLSTLLKSHWVVVYFYILFIISIFIISVISWAKYMLPVVVYIVTPQFNNEFYSLVKESEATITYINNGYLIRIYVIFQTAVFILSVVYAGRMLLNYVEKDNKNNKLIGISPNNQMILVDLRKEEEDDKLRENKEKLKMSLNEIFSFIREKIPFIKHNDKYNYSNNTSMV